MNSESILTAPARCRCAAPVKHRGAVRCVCACVIRVILAGSRPLLLRDPSPSGSRPAAAARRPTLASSGRAQPDHNVRFRGFRVTPFLFPASCRYAASFHPGRGPLPLRGSVTTLASSGRAQPDQRSSTSPTKSARVLVRP